MRRITGTNGSVTVSNLFEGPYRGELAGTYGPTTNFYTFPDTNGLVFAADCISVPTNWVGILAYSQSQADGKFALKALALTNGADASLDQLIIGLSLSLKSALYSDGTFSLNNGTLLGNADGMTGMLNIGDRNLNLRINLTEGQLIDGNNTLSVDWSSRRLYDASANQSVSWDGRFLWDLTGTESVDWQGRNLKDANGQNAAGWNDRQLLDSSAMQSIDWQFRNLYDAAGTDSVEWNERMLVDPSSALSIDWQNRTLNDINGTLIASWFNGLAGNGAGLTSLTAANISAGTAGINISGSAATVTAALGAQYAAALTNKDSRALTFANSLAATSLAGSNGVASYASNLTAVITLPGTNALLNVGRYTNATLASQVVTVCPTNASRYVDILLNGAYYTSNTSPMEISLQPAAWLQTTNCFQFKLRQW